MSLCIKNVHVSVEEKEIIRGVSLDIPKGEIHVLMGPNGSGKSTFSNALMSHPNYTITKGTITLDGQDITKENASKKAKAGLFLSMQYVPEIEGVSVTTFLRAVTQAKSGKKENPIAFYNSLKEKMSELGIDPAFAERSLNVGFSGGEKKRLEVLQLLILRPTYAILDETDSGLDVDALKIVAEGINAFHTKDTGILLITHYTRILQYIHPDRVHIVVDGRIVHSGGAELADVIEKKGYAEFIK